MTIVFLPSVQVEVSSDKYTSNMVMLCDSSATEFMESYLHSQTTKFLPLMWGFPGWVSGHFQLIFELLKMCICLLENKTIRLWAEEASSLELQCTQNICSKLERKVRSHLYSFQNLQHCKGVSNCTSTLDSGKSKGSQREDTTQRKPREGSRADEDQLKGG